MIEDIFKEEDQDVLFTYKLGTVNYIEMKNKVATSYSYEIIVHKIMLRVVIDLPKKRNNNEICHKKQG